MENKSPPQLSTRTETLQRYHSMTSPLVQLQALQKQESLKQELRNNASMRLDHIKNRNSKLYAIDTNSQNELKASAILYQIPEFSSPEVNFQVAEEIKKKVQEIKSQVITHLPQISKSSNYAPKKLQHQLNHRSAVRELEEWLKTKLKQPPTTSEDTIEYKNMIMGVGMKELIRIIGKRCNEEGRIAEQIWELTWGICREIILYLSKRAKKCEDLLDEEIKFMRLSYQKEFQRLQSENLELKTKVESLEMENKTFFEELTKIRKRKDFVEEQNKSLTYDNYHLQGEIKNILEENLAIYLQIGDKNKRGWVKKMYKSIANSPSVPSKLVNNLYQNQITETVEQRNRIQKITEELTEVLSKAEIEKIGHDILQDLERRRSIRQQKRASKEKNQKKNKKQKKKIERESISFNLTEPSEETLQNIEDKKQEEIIENHIEEENQSVVSKKSCEDLINNLKEQFKPINAETQTQTVTMIHAYASTLQLTFSDFSSLVEPYLLIDYEEIGVNTEEHKDEVKTQKKRGKENGKEDGRSKSKIYTGSIVTKEKLKTKQEKEKKSVLDIVPQARGEKLESNESDQDEMRLSEIKSSILPPELDTKKEMMTSSKIKTYQERLSQASSSEMKASRQNEERIQRSSQDPQRNNKMVSIFKKSESMLVQTNILNNSQSAYLLKTDENKEFRQNYDKVSEKKEETILKSPRLSKDQVVSQEKQIKENSPPIVKVNDIEVKSPEIIDSKLKEIKQPKNKGQKDHKNRDSSKGKSFKKNSPTGKFNETSKSNDSSFKTYEPTPPKESRISYSSLPKQSLIYICANCQKIMSVEQPKFLKEQLQTENLKSLKRASAQNNELVSLKKLGLPSQIQEQDINFEGRRLKKMPTRKSSGYIHDIAFKKEIEGHLKSPFSRAQDYEDKKEENEDEKLFYQKISPFKWMMTQLQTQNKDFIHSIIHLIPQNSQNLEQYLEIVREVNQLSEGKINMTDKYAASTIEKSIFPILNELLAPVKKAVKFNKIGDIMKMFTSLPSIVFNKISRKYGVKILAIKHLKMLLTAFKAASKFTDKYKTIQLMMFTDCKSPQSQDLFIYLLVMGLFDPTFSSNKTLTLDQALTIRQICEEHLSKEIKIYGGDWWDPQKEASGVDMGELIRSILTNYRLLKISRIQQLGFVFLMLKKDNIMNFKDFVLFMSTFKMDLSLKLIITKKLLQFCDVKNRDQKVGISENSFAKFLTVCQELTFDLLEKTLEEQNNLLFKDKETYYSLEQKMFNGSPTISKDTSNVNSHDEGVPSHSNNLEIHHLTSSTPQIRSQKYTLINEYQEVICKKEKISHYIRHYSSFTYQICKFLYNKEQTQYLTVRQKGLIKQYLMIHIFESEIQSTIGIVDYFSDTMMGLMWTPSNEFSIEKK